MLNVCRYGVPLLVASALAIAPSVSRAAPSFLPLQPFDPQDTLPGWSAWHPWGDHPIEFSTGFSNSEASHISNWSASCTARAKAANTEATFWSRTSDLVEALGTGLAEYGCVVDGQLASAGVQPAVRSDVEGKGACLQVNADVGNGLALHPEPSQTSPRLRVLPNGSTVSLENRLYALTKDNNDRMWLKIDRPQPGYISAAARAGEHINLRLCP